MADEKQRMYIEVLAYDPTNSLNKIERDISKLTTATKNATGGNAKLARGALGAAGASRVFARQFQNASYQLQDFVVQVGGGVSATRAFSQQAPQLLSAFGAIGAGFGLVAALVPTFIQMFMNAGEETKTFTEEVDELKSMLSDLGSYTDDAVKSIEELADEFGKSASNVAYFSKELRELELQQTQAKIKKLADGVREELTQGWTDSAFENALEDLQDMNFSGNQKDAIAGLAGALRDLEYSAPDEVVDNVRSLRWAMDDLVDAGIKLPQAMIDVYRETIQLGLETAKATGQIERMNDTMDKTNQRVESSAISMLTGANAGAEYAYSLEQAAHAIREANNPLTEYEKHMELLDILLEEGLITLNDYATAWDRVATAQGNFGDNEMTSGLNDMQKGLEGLANESVDKLVDGLMNANLNMKDLTQTFIRGAVQMALQLTILNALAATWNALTGGSAVVSGGALSFAGAAKGAAFDNNGMQAFANGGVVNSPTMFGMGGGGLGVMGEAGPEAILPLSRNRGGELGVKAEFNVQVTNNVGNAAVDVRREGNQLQIMINDIADNIRTGGVVSRAIEAAYRMPRRGGV